MKKKSYIIRTAFTILLSCLISWNVSAADVQLTSQEFVSEVHNKLPEVLEFKFIAEQAEKMGFRVWLFGGTASAFAHYVRWDLMRQKGDNRFQPDRFDYDYSNIFRSNQDLDIVINGNESQAIELERALAQTFPHLQGGKNAWEVRLLDQDMGDKKALLNNPDFLNQHTDSNSTGMIEITNSNELQIRDLRDWNNKESYFLQDILKGQLHYYKSDKHESTSFFKEGRNPPIVSAIRYLTKAFQYELNIKPEDYSNIKKIIDAYDPESETNSYVKKWIIKNAKKLMQNAVSIEYAWNTLENLGLRQKLMKFDNKSDVESLAWWMNREPLRTKPLGQGTGPTARELGIDVVAHETVSFLAYESITRAHTGHANVLISRSDGVGEYAAYGEGFYTRIGREGQANVATGLTIRFHVDPNARLGEDFDRGFHGNFLVIKNKAALKVIPESLNVGMLEYFNFLKKDDIGKWDLGILEKSKRRVNNRSPYISKEDEARLVEMIKKEISGQVDSKINPVLKDWFSFNISARHPELLSDLMKNGHVGAYIVHNILFTPVWRTQSEHVLAFIKTGTEDKLIFEKILSLPISEQINHPEWIDALIQNQKEDYQIIEKILSREEWMSHPKWIRWVDMLLQRGNMSGAVAHSILSKQHSNIKVEWFETVIRNAGAGAQSTVERALRLPQWQNHPRLKAISQNNEVNFDNLLKALNEGVSLRQTSQSTRLRCEMILSGLR